MLLRDLDLEADPTMTAFFLGRLASVVIQQVASVSMLERRLLARVAFSIYLDCLAMGMGEQAHEIMAQLRDESRPVVVLVA